jgi:hypothetical protein
LESQWIFDPSLAANLIQNRKAKPNDVFWRNIVEGVSNDAPMSDQRGNAQNTQTVEKSYSILSSLIPKDLIAVDFQDGKLPGIIDTDKLISDSSSALLMRR